MCLAAVLTLQVWTGAYRVERGVYSDDAAHFMNGLVIRDYLTTGLGQNPISFVEDYYLSYPKVAPLMWPPLFHVTLGLFLLPGWPPGAAALVLIALTTAWLLWRLYGIVHVLAGPLAAAVAVALTATTPLVQSMSSVVMLDVVIAACALEAAYRFARYVESGARSDAVIFGVFVAAACLTKGNGVALVLMPLLFILATRRIDVLFTRGLYVSGVIVLVFAAPILAISESLDAAIGDFGPVTAAVVLDRAYFYGATLWDQLSPLICLVAIAGAVIAAVRGWQRPGSGALPLAPALLALAVSAIVFHLLSPHRVSLSRYVTLAIGPIIGLAFVAARAATDRLSPARWRPRAFMVATVVLAAAAVTLRPGLHAGRPLGYRDVVAELAAGGHLAGNRLLVVSDEMGEGAFVTEIAVLGLHPAPTVIRGSKLLASDDWMGANFQLRYASPAALLADLEALHVSYVLLDQSKPGQQLPYYAQVLSIARAEPARFTLLGIRGADPSVGPLRELALYSVTSPTPGPAKPVEINLSYSLGRSLKR